MLYEVITIGGADVPSTQANRELVVHVVHGDILVGAADEVPDALVVESRGVAGITAASRGEGQDQGEDRRGAGSGS